MIPSKQIVVDQVVENLLPAELISDHPAFKHGGLPDDLSAGHPGAITDSREWLRCHKQIGLGVPGPLRVLWTPEKDSAR